VEFTQATNPQATATRAHWSRSSLSVGLCVTCRLESWGMWRGHGGVPQV